VGPGSAIGTARDHPHPAWVQAPGVGHRARLRQRLPAAFSLDRPCDRWGCPARKHRKCGLPNAGKPI